MDDNTLPIPVLVGAAIVILTCFAIMCINSDTPRHNCREGASLQQGYGADNTSDDYSSDDDSSDDDSSDDDSSDDDSSDDDSSDDDSSNGILPESHSSKRNVSIDPDRFYTEEEAADKAIKAKGLTILRSDTGKLWKSSRKSGKPHAEDRFLDDGTEDVKTIWLKNSPCLKCAQRLNRERSSMHIYIGKVYHEKNTEREDERKDEIKEMKRNRFTFSAWEVYCRKKGKNTLKKTQDDIEKEL